MPDVDACGVHLVVEDLGDGFREWFGEGSLKGSDNSEGSTHMHKIKTTSSKAIVRGS